MKTKPGTLARAALLTSAWPMVVSIAVGVVALFGGLAGGLLAAGLDGGQAFKVPQGRVDNVRFERSPGGVVTVYYDLRADDPTAVFSVTLEVSPPSGEPRIAKSVTGDVGSNVKPGAGKKILWEANKDVESLQLDQFRFNVLAEAGPVKRVDAGTLIITSQPPGAAVELDGKARGKTPVTVKDLTPGKHRIQFTLAGYLENVREVDVVAGQSETIQATLTKGEAAAQKKGGNPMKWILPLAGGGAAAAVLLASSGGDGGGDDGKQPCTTAPAVQISNVTASPNEVGLESVTEFTFTASGINGCRESGKTVDIAWNFGDGNTRSVANVDTTSTVTYTYTRSGTFTVQATVTDGRPASASASKAGIVVANMTGTWKGVSTLDGGVTRTLVLTQQGTSLTGTYQLASDAPLPLTSGTVSTPKNMDITTTASRPTPTQFRGPISADLNSFEGTAVQGTGHPGQIITFRRQ